MKKSGRRRRQQALPHSTSDDDVDDARENARTPATQREVMMDKLRLISIKDEQAAKAADLIERLEKTYMHCMKDEYAELRASILVQRIEDLCASTDDIEADLANEITAYIGGIYKSIITNTN